MKIMRILLLAVILTVCARAAMATDYFMGGDTTQTAYMVKYDSTVFVQPFTSGANAGYADSMIAWIHDDYHGPFQVAFVIGQVVGSDTNVIDSTSYFTVTGSANNRYSAAFKENVAISASTIYLLGMHADGEGGTNGPMWLCVSSTAGYLARWTQTPTATIPSPLTNQYFDSNNRAIAGGLWYSDGAPPEAPTGRRRRILQ